ncbi:MAG: DUF2147 domain-containing protein [Alphaproteobacteria bacterium]
MKSFLRAWIGLALGLAALFPAVAKADGHASHEVVGLWDTAYVGNPPRYLVVDIGPCESDSSLYCGEIIEAPDADNPEYFLTKLILFDLQDLGEGIFGKGKVWNPLDNNVYTGKMELMENGGLKVAGCIIGICQSQEWTRTPQ